jgi:hypothetical protein
MSMYVDILSQALEDWVDDLSGDALIEFAQKCRAQMLCPSPPGSTTSTALSAELSYDRALVKLCEAHGIDVKYSSFSRPDQERARLERRLVAIGVDLVASSRGPGKG